MSDLNAVLARNTDNAPKVVGPFSQTVAFSHYNNLSAQLPIEPKTGVVVPGGVEAQAEQCFKNINAILENINHSLTDVVRITVFLKNIMDLDAVESVYRSYFSSHFPTRTTVAVAALPMDALVQIEALVANGVGTIPNAPQAGDLVKLANNTANATQRSFRTSLISAIRFPAMRSR